MTLKDNIKNKTIVKLRDGRIGIVLHDLHKHGLNNTPDDLTIYGPRWPKSGYPDGTSCDIGIADVRSYNDDLEYQTYSGVYAAPYDRDYDIIAYTNSCVGTYLVPQLTLRIIYGLIYNLHIVWDWKREEAKEVTMADVEEKFGCKVKIIKEEN